MSEKEAAGGAAGGSSIRSDAPFVVDAIRKEKPSAQGASAAPLSSPARAKSSVTEYTAKMDRVIFPSNKVIKMWDMVVLCCLYILTFILPYQIGVSGGYLILTSITWLVINVLINAVFFVDTFLYFYRAYRTKEGQLVFNLRKIQMRYLRGLFIPNLISVLPFTIVFYVTGTNFLNSVNDGDSTTDQSNNFLFLILFAGFLKLIRLIRVRSITSSSDIITHVRLRSNSQWLSLCKYIFLIVVIMHWFACIWCFVAFLEAKSFSQGLLNKPNWIGNWYQGSYVEGGPNPIGYDKSVDRYVIALFWAIQVSS